MELEKKDFILLIMNCVKYRYKAELQKEGWLKTIPTFIHYYHVLGDPTLSVDFHFDEEERILWVKTKDDYNSLPYKVISAYTAVHQTFKYKYIFKTDDDQMLKKTLFFNTFTKLLLSKVESIHYGGFIVDVPREHISTYNLIHEELPNNLLIKKIKYCNGRFYFLSNNAVTYLVTRKKDFLNEYLEDYAVGLYLENTPFKKDILFFNTRQIFDDST